MQLKISFVLCISVLSFSVWSDYSIQTGCFSDTSSAEQMQQSIEDMGVSPVNIINEKGMLKVCAGSFSSYLNATFFKNKLNDTQFIEGAFIRKDLPANKNAAIRSSVEKTPSSFDIFGLSSTKQSAARKSSKKSSDSLGMTDDEIRAASDSLLTSAQLHRKIKLLYQDLHSKKRSARKLESSPLAQMKSFVDQQKSSNTSLQQHMDTMMGIVSMELKDRSAGRNYLKNARSKNATSFWGMLAGYQLGLLELQEGKTDAAEKVFEEMISENPESQTSGKAALRLGYNALNKKDPIQAKDYFLRVGRGEVAASNDDRFEAMYRWAKLSHSKKDLYATYKAYDEIASFMQGEPEYLQLQVEKAGLLLEGALCQKGTFSDCRDLCEEILLMSNVASENLKYQARAALMLVESLHYEKQYTESITRINEIKDRFTSCSLEYEGILFWLAENYRKTGAFSKAHNAYAQVYDSETVYTDRFAAFHPKCCALYSGGLLYRRQNKRTNADALFSRLIQEYPDTKEAKRAQKNLSVNQKQGRK